MNKYLIAIDSDGTLKDSNGIISDKTKKVLNKLKNDNVIVLCTGRPRYHVKNINSELKLSNYIISSNGAEIYDVEKNEVVYSKYIDKKILKSIYEDSIKENIRLIFVVDDIEYVTEYTTNDSQIFIDDKNIDELVKLNVKQIMFFGNDYDKINDYKNKINGRYNLSIIDSAFKKDYSWFCVNDKNCNKGNAIKFLSKYLNIDKDKTIAIGNDNNDISMIKYAKIGVAVNNATKELLDIADYITESNDEDGVYLFLKKWSDNNERNII